MKPNRFCLKQDEDSHWYLIPVELAKEFESVCERAYIDDEYENFNSKFEQMRIDGPHRLTFINPEISK